ncbi:MAG: hypothetical protein WCS28_12435 [Thiomicrospira sp.]|jgi:ribosomal protein L31E
MTWQQRAKQNHQRIKAFYEAKGGTKWLEVTVDHRLFNRVWRKMLKLPASDMPPSVEFR